MGQCALDARQYRDFARAAQTFLVRSLHQIPLKFKREKVCEPPPDFVLVGSIEDRLPGTPLGQDKGQRRLAGGPGHTRQKLEHSSHLGVDQVCKHQHQALEKTKKVEEETKTFLSGRLTTTKKLSSIDTNTTTQLEEVFLLQSTHKT